MAKRGNSHAAYLAGFFDGEGHVGIDVRSAGKSEHSISFILKVKLTQAASPAGVELLEEIATDFGGSLSTKSNGRNPRWSEALEWCATTRNAAAFLEYLLPYLRIKKRQAEIGLAFQARRLAQGQRSPNPKARIAADLADKEQISMLNSRVHGKKG